MTTNPAALVRDALAAYQERRRIIQARKRATTPRARIILAARLIVADRRYQQAKTQIEQYDANRKAVALSR